MSNPETIRVMRGNLDCIINKSDMKETDVIYSEKKEVKKPTQKKTGKKTK